MVFLFSRRVRRMRRAAKLSQAALAERAYCRVAFISRIERGEANPSLVTMTLIAAGLGCTVVDLLTAEERA